MPGVAMRYDDDDDDEDDDDSDEIKGTHHLVLPPFASLSSELALGGGRKGCVRGFGFI